MTLRGADGLSRDDRFVAALVNLAHAQLTVAMAKARVKSHRIPKLTAFIPMPPEPKPKPRTFDDWARLLDAAFGG